MTISEIIKKLPYKTSHIAKVLGVTQDAVRKYMNGSNTPKLETLVKLAELAKMSIEDIVKSALKGNQ